MVPGLHHKLELRLGYQQKVELSSKKRAAEDVGIAIHSRFGHQPCSPYADGLCFGLALGLTAIWAAFPSPAPLPPPADGAELCGNTVLHGAHVSRRKLKN